MVSVHIRVTLLVLVLVQSLELDQWLLLQEKHYQRVSLDQLILTLYLYLSASSSPLIKVTPVFINSLTVAYTVPVLNDTTIDITWSPPSYPNGDITGYIVRIATDATITSSNVPFISGKVSYTLFFGGLS